MSNPLSSTPALLGQSFVKVPGERLYTPVTYTVIGPSMMGASSLALYALLADLFLSDGPI